MSVLRRVACCTALAAAALGATAGPAAARLAFEDRKVVTPDGESIFFASYKPLTADDTDADKDLFVHRSGETRLVSTGPTGDGATGHFDEALFISDDGWRVLFETAKPLTAADTDLQPDVYERVKGKTALLSTGPTDPGLVPTEFFEHGVELDGYAADGRVAFFSTLGRLVAADTDSARDVYMRADGVTTLVSTDAAGRNMPGAAKFRAASADGSRVFFYTTDALVPEDRDNGGGDVYVREGARVTLVSTGTLGGSGTAPVSSLRVSLDGRIATFATRDALEPTDTDLSDDVYQRSGSTTRLVSANHLGLSRPCSETVDDPRGSAACDAILHAQSDDGRDVVFDTAERLVPEDRNTARDLYGTLGGQLTWISAGHPENEETAGDVMMDGGRVTFESAAKLVPEDTGWFTHDVYQRAGGRTTLVSTPDGDGHSNLESVSADGRRVMFTTSAALVAEDRDRSTDLYVWDGAERQLVSTGPAAAPDGNFLVVLLGHSADGSRLVFRTRERLTADDLDDEEDTYVRFGGQTTLLSSPPPAG